MDKKEFIAFNNRCLLYTSDKRGTVRRFALSQVYEVITDEKLSKQNIATLENAGIMVKVVS